MSINVNNTAINRVYCNSTDMEAVVTNGTLVQIRPFYIQTTNGGQAAYRKAGTPTDWTEQSTNTTEQWKTMFVRVHIPSNINLTSTTIMTNGPLTNEHYYMRYVTNPSVPDLASGDMSGYLSFHWSGNYAGGGYVEFAQEMNYHNPCLVNLYINNVLVKTYV